MTTNELRQKFLDFFQSAPRNHAIIPSASLIPENDPTVLFTTAGMHPLVPYLLGEPHPMGKRLTNVQKCIRTQDIEEVGDGRHTTFFGMLGVWSLGDYFKEAIIPWTFEFFTEELGFEAARLYVSVFQGDEAAPRDDESIDTWKKLFSQAGMSATVAAPENPNIDDGHRVYQYPKGKNWWGPAGQTGPCGPDTEIFYDTGRPHQPSFGKHCHPNCDCGRFVEIGNDVFMQFEKTETGAFAPLRQKNVDVGWGLERLAAIVQGKTSIFEIDLFVPVIAEIERLSGKPYKDGGKTAKSMEIIADHVRTATFIIGDQHGVGPSNKDQGYIVRRLIRRAILNGRELGIEGKFTVAIAEVVTGLYGDTYSELRANRERIVGELDKEEDKFSRTLEKGLVEASKLKERLAGFEDIPGTDAFYLYESFGFPKELTEEVLGKKVNAAEWAAETDKHAAMSRAGAEQKFAGGLADHSEIVTRYHTATHLLDQALRTVLGPHVEQRGSNLTAERLRFDFSHPAKVTPEELARVEQIVNEQIVKDLPVHFEMMTVAEAKAAGAIGIFEDKYAAMGGKVKVYFIGDEARGYFSKEICGGPHVEHTAEIGLFKITKEEASSAGIRRIKAVIA
jgi:alanyl-tRNA synthetase